MRVGRWTAALVAIVALAVTAGCGGGGDSDASGGGDSSKQLKIAFLSASTANTWLAASKKAMQKVADERGNVEIVEFDGQFKPEEQQKQLQDAIASGQYDGIMLTALGPGIIPDVETAIDKGIKVAELNQVLGDKLDTADPQVEGMSVSVMAPPLRSGERIGKLTVKACEGLDPCRVVYFYGIKGIPLDIAIKKGFDSVVKENPAIKVVAEGEGQYLGPDVGMKQMQDILQKTPDFDVVAGADQPMQGAQQALEQAGKLSKVKIIGFGGSSAAVDAVRDGKWFGDLFGAPYTEGRLAMEALLKALDDGEDSGGIDPATTLTDEGLITKENVAKFKAEWNG
jgi:ribose transport system substrate-binding protein